MSPLFSLFLSGILVAGLLWLAGCRPVVMPSVHRVDGHPVTQSNPTPVAKAPTVTRNGVDYWVSPYPQGRWGGTFYQASFGNGPKTFNAWAAFDATSSALADYLLAGLVTSNAFTGEVEPLLARRIDVAPDGCTYTVHLRRGLRWSDGQPLTSADVTFTWNTIIKNGLGNPSMRDIVSVNGQFPTVQALDVYTIRFQTTEPFAPFLRSLSVAIAPRHVFQPIIQKGGDAAFAAAWGTQQAATQPQRFVSSGDWVLESYLPGERVVYRRNPYSFKVAPNGKTIPYLERMVVSFVKNENNLQLQFEQGGMDIYGVPAQYLQRLRHFKRFPFRLEDMGPTSTTTFLAFNLSQRHHATTRQPLVPPQHSQWLNNRDFRLALDWALDRQRMVDNLLKGVGQPLFTAEGLTSAFVHPQLAKGHPVNLEKARAHLKAGGFSWDQSGQLRDKHNNPVELTLLTNSGNDLRESTGVQIQQDLAQLGIRIHFKPMEFNTLVQKMNTGDWELMIMGLSGGGSLEPHFSANVWKSTGALHLMNQRPPNSADPPPDRRAWEAEIDALFDQGVRVLEAEARKPIYWRYQEIVAEEALLLYLYAPRAIVAVKDRVQNTAFTPMGGTLHNLESVWVAE